MTWAVWRWQHGRESALKAHVKFNLLEQKPVGVKITTAKRCERKVLREQWQAGEFYVGDRYYGEDYALFAELEAAGCSYVLRLRQEAVFEVLEEFPLRAEDRAASVTFEGLVRLGSRAKNAPVRLVRVQTEEGEILLVTDKPREELCAELVALIYRYRWRIELFFKWLKCIPIRLRSGPSAGLPALAGRIPARRGAAHSAGSGPSGKSTAHSSPRCSCCATRGGGPASARWRGSASISWGPRRSMS